MLGLDDFPAIRFEAMNIPEKKQQEFPGNKCIPKDLDMS